MTPLALVDRAPERLSPLERLEVLCDPGSLDLVRSAARSRRMADRAVPGDGVLCGTGRVDGRPVSCFAQDPAFLGGSLGSVHADGVVGALRHAGRARIPVVGFVESAGARMQEGVDALAGYGRIFRETVALSGRVPQVSVVCGPAAGGGAYGPALGDFTIMAGANASLFLTGPGVVKEVMGEDVDAATLGGPRVHGRKSGVAQFTTADEVDAGLLVRDLLDYLPPHCGVRPLRWPTAAPGDDRPDRAVPSEPRKVYDVRRVISAIADGGRMLEVSSGWARNIVCALARIDGHAVGVVANQPKFIGGVLDADAAQKGARFVGMCDRFNLPLVVLVDTPGFLPGVRQEEGGVIRHGAKLVHAFAAATVPRVTVVTRKAFGGALIAMNSKALGADAVFAWPGAALGVMGAPQAVGFTHRREIAAAADPVAARAALAVRYEAEHLGAAQSAADGHVDEVIAPSDTRARLARVLGHLVEVPLVTSPARNLPL